VPAFLHIGCGQQTKAGTTRGFNTPEWSEVRLDIDPDARPDILASMTDMAAVADGAMDAIFSSHNIEHLYPAEVEVALREFARVLKPDGFAVINCPDLQSVAVLVAQGKLLEPAYISPAGPISPIDIIYGHRPALAQGNLFMAHRSGFTQNVLSTILRECGFPGAIVRQRPRHFDLWAVATPRPTEVERLRDLAAQHFPAER
jgi:SAM-dependent methyltransferase